MRRERKDAAAARKRKDAAEAEASSHYGGSASAIATPAPGGTHGTAAFRPPSSAYSVPAAASMYPSIPAPTPLPASTVGNTSMHLNVSSAPAFPPTSTYSTPTSVKSPVSSPMVPPNLAANVEFFTDSTDMHQWGNDPRPPGGFMSFFHNQSQLSQNFHKQQDNIRR